MEGKRLIATLLFCMLLGFISCVSNNEEELYPCNVDTEPVTYRNTISVIIERNCAESCHGFNGTSGIFLRYYDGLKNIADAERLIGALRHLPGYSPMPQGEPQLLECDILKIEKWISEGKLYN